MAGEILQYRRLVEDYADKLRLVDLFELFVAYDYQPVVVSHFGEANHFKSKTLALGYCLFTYRQRREYDHGAVFMMRNLISPFELHQSFALTATCEDAAFAEFQHAPDAIFLKVKQEWRQLTAGNIKTTLGNL